MKMQETVYKLKLQELERKENEKSVCDNKDKEHQPGQ